MPYSARPPGLMSRLSTITSCPPWAIFCAANSPAGPAPTTNTVFKFLLSGQSPLFSPTFLRAHLPCHIGPTRRHFQTHSAILALTSPARLFRTSSRFTIVSHLERHFMRAAAILFCFLPLLAQEQVPSKAP